MSSNSCSSGSKESPARVFQWTSELYLQFAQTVRRHCGHVKTDALMKDKWEAIRADLKVEPAFKGLESTGTALQMQFARLAKRVQSEGDASSALHRLVEEMITFEPQVKEERVSQEEVKRRQREAKERRERKQNEEENSEGEEGVRIVVSADKDNNNTNHNNNKSPKRTYPLRSGNDDKHTPVSFADERERGQDEEYRAMKRRRLEIEERRLALEEKRTEIHEREVALREKETETRQREYQMMQGMLRYFSAVEKGLN